MHQGGSSTTSSYWLMLPLQHRTARGCGTPQHFQASSSHGSFSFQQGGRGQRSSYSPQNNQATRGKASCHRTQLGRTKLVTGRANTRNYSQASTRTEGEDLLFPYSTPLAPNDVPLAHKLNSLLPQWDFSSRMTKHLIHRGLTWKR